MKNLSWAKMLMQFSYLLTIICMVLMVFTVIFFNRKIGIKKTAIGMLDNSI